MSHVIIDEERRTVKEAGVRLDAWAGKAYVQSQSDPTKTYIVDLFAATCTCPDFRYRGTTCKHIRAARKAVEEAGRAALTGEGLTLQERAARNRRILWPDADSDGLD